MHYKTSFTVTSCTEYLTNGKTKYGEFFVCCRFVMKRHRWREKRSSLQTPRDGKCVPIDRPLEHSEAAYA